MRRAAGSVAALLVASLVAGSMGVAFARPDQRGPSQRLARARATLARMNARQSLLDEEYDQAVISLRQAKARLATTRARARSAARTAATARRALSRRVRAAYEGEGSAIGVVLGATTPQRLSDRVEYLAVIAASDAQLANRATQAQNRARIAAGEQAAAVRQRAAAVKRLAAKRHALVTIVGRQEKLITQLRASVRQARERARRKRARTTARPTPAPRAPAGTPAPASRLAPAPATSRSHASHPVHPSPPARPSPSPSPTPPPPPPRPSSKAGIAVRAAYSVLGVPYVYAGASPKQGFDCSGLTMWAWAKAGVRLPHSAALQYATIRHVARGQLRPGDLLFFYSPIHHVAMYVGGGMMIEAPHTGAVVRKVPVYWQMFVGAGRPGV
jgi:cell wall-associated NlpC family hydrolase